MHAKWIARRVVPMISQRDRQSTPEMSRDIHTKRWLMGPDSLLCLLRPPPTMHSRKVLKSPQQLFAMIDSPLEALCPSEIAVLIAWYVVRHKLWLWPMSMWSLSGCCHFNVAIEIYSKQITCFRPHNFLILFFCWFAKSLNRQWPRILSESFWKAPKRQTQRLDSTELVKPTNDLTPFTHWNLKSNITIPIGQTNNSI